VSVSIFTPYSSRHSPAYLGAHVGTPRDFARWQREALHKAARGGVGAVRKLAPELLARIADDRTLHFALEHVATHGGPATGPDGLRAASLGVQEGWDLVRCLAEQIKTGGYRHGPVRSVLIPKLSGGHREIVLENLADRVVARAAVEVLQAVLDPLLGDRVFCRPEQGPYAALSHADFCVGQEGRTLWILADIRTAFDSVPLERLLRVVRKLLPADDLCEFIVAILKNGTSQGLRQGSALSMLLLNVFLNSLLDEPWRRNHGAPPLLRYADDIAVLARPDDDVQGLYAELKRRVESAGFELKGDETTDIRDLTAGGFGRWLGWQIAQSDGRLVVRAILDEGERGPLAELPGKLALLHGFPMAPFRALDHVGGLLEHLGPTYRNEDREAVFHAIRRIASEQGFDELGSFREFDAKWRGAYRRWRRRRLATRKRLLEAD
jgi:hypothetical protein